MVRKSDSCRRYPSRRPANRAASRRVRNGHFRCRGSDKFKPGLDRWTLINTNGRGANRKETGRSSRLLREDAIEPLRVGDSVADCYHGAVGW